MTKRLKTVVILFLFYFSSTVYSASITEKVYLTLDANTGATLIEKDADKKIYPASTTKILTCIIALENLDLSEEVYISQDMLNQVPYGSSTMKLVAGETLSVKQLLYGLMVPSGNDAAVVIAYKISGSIDEFSNLMNKKALELGCNSSNFTCPHGFHNENHYTTARDMSKIMMYAIKNQQFLEIINTKNFSIPANNIVNYERKYTSTNLLIGKTDYTICGKTGYTDEAGNVFVSYSKKDDFNLISLLYDGAKGYYDGNYRFEDTLTINNYIFNNYSQKSFLNSNTINIQYIDKNLSTQSLYTNATQLNLLTNDAKKSISYNLNQDFFTDSSNIYLNILSNGYGLRNYELNLSAKSSQNISYNYNFTFYIKLIFSIFMDILVALIFFISLIQISILKSSNKKKKIKKKYY